MRRLALAFFTVGTLACPGDDGGGDAGDSATAGEDGSGPGSASAEDGPEPTSGDGSASVSGSASASGSAGDGSAGDGSAGDGSAGDGSAGDDGGPPPDATCCSACPDGTIEGDACSDYGVPPPCCTASQLFTCENVQCGSQVCAGQWMAGTCDCTARTAYHGSVLQAVVRCDPADGRGTCAVSDTLVDTCGCPAVVNTASPDLGTAAAVQQAWIDAQCGPLGCGAPCIVEGTPACVGDEQNGHFCALMP